MVLIKMTCWVMSYKKKKKEKSINRRLSTIKSS